MFIDYKIAKLVIEAQVASDNGKLIESELTASYSGVGGYDEKDKLIYAAVSRIASSRKNTGFSFYVEKGPDQNGHDSLIVYFEFKLNNEVMQISFHTFNWRLEKFARNSKHVKAWDHQLNGSRMAAIMLDKHLKLKTGYYRGVVIS